MLLPNQNPINLLVAICGYTFLHREFERPPTFVLHAVILFLLGGLVGCLNASGNDSSTTEAPDVGTPSTSPEFARKSREMYKNKVGPEPIVINVVISPHISGILLTYNW